MKRIGEGNLIRKNLILLVFVFFSLFSLIVGFHHHRDGKPHPECGICLLQHDFSSSSIFDFSIEFFKEKVFLSYPEKPYQISIVRYFKPSGRCPPYFPF